MPCAIAKKNFKKNSDNEVFQRRWNKHMRHDLGATALLQEQSVYICMINGYARGRYKCFTIWELKDVTDVMTKIASI